MELLRIIRAALIIIKDSYLVNSYFPVSGFSRSTLVYLFFGLFTKAKNGK
jgi:hypothetical protein